MPRSTAPVRVSCAMRRVIRFHHYAYKKATAAGCTAAAFLFSCRYYFKPIAVGVLDEVYAHGGVFVAYAAHFFMQRMGGGIIVGAEGKMKFTLPKLIALRLAYRLS